LFISVVFQNAVNKMFMWMVELLYLGSIWLSVLFCW